MGEFAAGVGFGGVAEAFGGDEGDGFGGVVGAFGGDDGVGFGGVVEAIGGDMVGCAGVVGALGGDSGVSGVLGLLGEDGTFVGGGSDLGVSGTGTSGRDGDGGDCGGDDTSPQFLLQSTGFVTTGKQVLVDFWLGRPGKQLYSSSKTTLVLADAGTQEGASPLKKLLEKVKLSNLGSLQT